MCATFPDPSHFPRLDHLNVREDYHLTKLFPVQFSPFFYYILPPESKCFPQPTVFEKIFGLYSSLRMGKLC
jgi:hypothetical protein